MARSETLVKEAVGGTLMRDQKRAIYAYEVVSQVDGKVKQRNYKIAVNDLGSNIIRGGLVAAIAAVERLGDRGEIILSHLAGAKVPGLEQTNAKTISKVIRELDADKYIIATREMLRVASWLKRATQATFGDD